MSDDQNPSRNRRFESLRERLKSQATELPEVINELKDFLDRCSYYGADQPNYMVQIFPELIQTLRRIPPQFTDCAENTARQNILEIVLKCPNLEPFRNFNQQLYKITEEVMNSDNEENAALAIKLHIELARTFKDIIAESNINQFVRYAEKMFQDYKEICLRAMNRKPGQLLHRDSSLKVLIECGNAITSLYHSFQKYVPMKHFITYSFEIVCSEDPEGLNKDQKFKKDYMLCKTRILKFLAQFSQSERFVEEFKNYEDRLPKSIIDMMRKFPSDAYNIKKDLYHGFSVIIKSNHKRGFCKHIDSMLEDEEQVLAPSSIRSSWYNAMLEFCDIFRNEMSTPQLCKAIALICRNIHLFVQFQLQAVVILKNYLESVRSAKDSSNRMVRDRNFTQIDLMYRMILLTVTQRLKYCRGLIEEFLKHYKDKHSQARSSLNIHEVCALLKRLSDLAKFVILEKVSGGASPAMIQDFKTVKLITKIFKNMIISSRIYVELGAEREEISLFEIVSQLLSNLHHATLKDILQELMPFLFVKYLETANTIEIFKMVKRTNRDNALALGDIVIGFAIDNLEVMEPESTVWEAKMLSIYNKAKYKPNLANESKDMIKKRFWTVLELVLNSDVLEAHGKRLIEKCEELCKTETIPRFVMLARRCIGIAFKNEKLRRELATPWIQQLDPILLPSPPQNVIFSTLYSSSHDRVYFACILLDENLSRIKITPELLKRLFELLHRTPQYSYHSVILELLGKLGPYIREKRDPISFKCRKMPFNNLSESLHPTYAFYVPIKYDPEQPPVRISLDYILSKISKIFRDRLSIYETQKKTLLAASKLLSSALSSFLGWFQVDQKLLSSKISSVLFGKRESGLFQVSTNVPKMHRMAFQETLKNCVETIISLLAFSEMSDELGELFEVVCIHIGLFLFCQVEGDFTDVGFNPTELLDVLSEKLAYVDKGDDRFIAALKGIQTILNTVGKLLQRNEPALSRSESVRQVLLSLERTCYKQEWTTQVGACGGLNRLLPKFPQSLIQSHAELLLRTSLHILECFPATFKTLLIDEPVNLFKLVVDYVPKEAVVGYLAGGLFSRSPVLRQQVRNLLGSFDADLSSLVVPLQSSFSLNRNEASLRDQVVEVVFSQSLASVHLTVKAAVLETFTYLVENQLLEICSENIAKIHKLLTDVMKEHEKVEDPKEDRANTTGPDVILQEKVAFCGALKAFISSPSTWELIAEKNDLCTNLRNKIASVFLVVLSQSRDQQVTEIAKQGVVKILSEDKNTILPQEELKQCLRPILLELAKSSKPPSLLRIQNLARLLEVISNCFNTNLGNRLLRHLNDYCNEHNRPQLPLIPNIANLFHLMPHCAVEILPDVIKGFMKAEESLQKNGMQGFLNSIISHQLIKFLVRFPSEIIEFFFEKEFHEKKLLRYFINLLKHPMGFGLRDIVARRYQEILITKCFSDYGNTELVYKGMKIVNGLTKYMNRWISTKEDLISVLKTIWDKRLANPVFDEKELIKATYIEKYLVKAFISYIRFNIRKGVMDVLFELPLSYGRKNIWNSDFLTNFLQKELPQILCPRQKFSTMKQVMEFLSRKEVSDGHKSKVLEHFVIPFLMRTFKMEQGKEVIQKSLQDSSIRLIKHHLEDYSNQLCVQLMNLGSILIENLKEEFYPYRKVLIKFFWGMIKSENPIIKGNAYVNVARFINVYNLPDTLTVQLLGALLKAHHNELQPSSQQAFSYLSEKLSALFRDAKLKDYLTDFVRKNLFHETREFSSMMHVIDIIIKNQSVFYHIREGLTNHFLSWINHLGLGLHSNYNAKKTLLDLTALMIEWSQRHAEESSESYIAAHHKEMLINFFARFGQAPALYISKQPQRSFEQMNFLSTKCQQNLKRALSLWGDVNFKAKNWTDALKKCMNLVQQNQNQPHRTNVIDSQRKLLIRSLDIIKILSEHPTRNAIIQYPDLVRYLASQVKANEYPNMIKLLCDIISNLLEVPANEILMLLNEILESSLSNDCTQNYSWAVKLLAVISEVSPIDITIHMKNLLLMCSSLIKEIQQDMGPIKEIKIDTLLTALKIIHNNITALNEDHKKILKHLLSSIFECKTESKLIMEGCKVIEIWLESSENDPMFTTKDKCSLLLNLFKSFRLEISHASVPLEIALRVLSNNKDSFEPRITLCKNILHFLLKDPAHSLKPEFDRVLKDMLGTSVWRRLIFVTEQLDAAEPKAWAKSSVDLLLGCLEEGVVVRPQLSDDFEDSFDRDTAEFLRQHQWYIHHNSLKSGSDVLKPLRQMINLPAAHYFFCYIFPQLWSTFSTSQQSTLAHSLENLLLNRFSAESSFQYFPVKTILISIASSYPQPVIRPEILQFLAKTHNAWNIVIPMLESYYESFGDRKNNIYIENLLERLNEKEQLVGSWISRAVNPETVEALSHLVVGNWTKCRAKLEQLLQNENYLNDMEILQKAWVQCVQNTGDWQTLRHYGSMMDDLSLVEACWHLNDKLGVKEAAQKLGVLAHPTVQHYLQVLELLELSPEEFFSQVKEMKKKEDHLSISSVVREWGSLPKYPCSAHTPIIQQLDMKFEFNECLQLTKPLEEIAQSGVPAQQVNNKVFRSRITSMQDGVGVWESLFKARTLTFDIMNSVLSRMQGPSSSSQFEESTWTKIHYARLLRKSGSYRAALNLLKQIDHRINSENKFLLNREIFKLCFENKEYEAALSAINKYLQEDSLEVEYKSELMRLKGKVYSSNPDAYQLAYSSFANSSEVWANNLNTWLNWGCLIAKQLQKTPSLCANAVCCLLLGLRKNPEKHKNYLPKIFLLLEKAPEKDSLDEYFLKLPCKVYLPWIPQMLRSLSKPHGETYFKICQKLVDTEPQKLFFHVRSLLIEKEELRPEEESQEKLHLVKLHTELKSKHPLLAETLNFLSTNLTQNLKLSLEEDLYSALNVLHEHLCRSETSSQVLQKAFQLITEKFFLKEENQEFSDKYFGSFCEEFNTDLFDDSSQTKKALKRWMEWLSEDLVGRFSLEQECLELATFYSKEIKIPVAETTLERFISQVETLKLKNCNRVLGVRGGDASDHHMLLQVTAPYKQDSLLLNQVMLLMSHYLNSTSIPHTIRGSNFYLYEGVTLDPRHILLGVPPNAVSLQTVYELVMDEQSQDSESPAEVSRFLFVSYIQRCLQSADRFAAFKNQFTAQWGLLYVLCLVLNTQLEEQTLSNIWFCKTNGAICFNLMNLGLGNSGEFGLRMSPNIVTMLGRTGIQGTMPAIICNACRAILKKWDSFGPALEFILRDQANFDLSGVYKRLEKGSEPQLVARHLQELMNCSGQPDWWHPWF